MATMQQLVNRTIKRLSQIGGVSTSLYSDDIIQECIQHKFDVLFDKAWWPQFVDQDITTLDGASGVVTSNYTNRIKRFMDVGAIYLDGCSTPLRKVPRQYNGLSNNYGYAAINNPVKVFRILPITTTGRVCVNYRTKPDTYNLDDEVNFDDQCMILGAAYDYLESDGSNPGDAAKLLSFFEARVQQLVDANEANSFNYNAQANVLDGGFRVV